MQTSTIAHNAYRLRGVVHGAERIFNLNGREHRIGRAGASDLMLPADGVSRSHALLRVMPEGLEVEDAGSRNGTFINGKRVERALVPPGAELAFGPIRLRVETVDADDVELALALEPGALGSAEIPAPIPDPAEITQVLSGFESTHFAGLPVLEGFIERLSGGPRPDLTAALAFLAETLAVVGCCVVEWTAGGDAIVLAAAGEIPELPAYEQVRRLVPAPDRSAPGIRTAFFDTRPVLSLAAHFGLRQELRCLLLWGEFAGRLGSAALLGILVRLVELVTVHNGASSGDSADPTSERARELVFPDGYHPGTSSATVKMYRQLRQVVRSNLPVLIVGETGVGKERVARILHASSERRQGPFVAVNCAAIPGEILEAEMFGIGKGVATGVVERSGWFQLAEGGTLVLDEISEMQPALQAKLLRVLEEKEIHPVGSRRPRKINVRVVAATNADVMRIMEEGLFRRDLFYRLAGHLVEVPPLRRSQADIPGLVEHFLRVFSQENGTRVRGVTAKALRLLKAYPWPGNVRELEHEMRRLVDSSDDGQVIDSGMLAQRIRLPSRSPAVPRVGADGDSLVLGPRLQELEGQLIREALRLSEGKQIEAARLLGISRNGLSKKLKRLGIHRRYSAETAGMRANRSISAVLG